MIVYSRDKKLLIVPSGIGNLDQEYKQGFEDGKAYQESADQTKLTQITIDRNGTYEADYGFSSVVVDVPQSGSCDFMLGDLLDTPHNYKDLPAGYYIKQFEKGPYTQTDGWSAVTLDLSHIFLEGKLEQKSYLSAGTFTQNGTYTREDGWSAVTINVPQSGSSCNLDEGGYIVGTQSPEFVTLTPDEGYDGFSKVIIDCTQVNQAYTDGYIYGRQFQKSQLAQTAITQNGTYNREDGWDRVVVNVPQTGTTYQEGFTDGYASGYTAGQQASGSPWFGFRFYLDTAGNAFTGNPMNIYLKVKGPEDNYGFVDMISGRTAHGTEESLVLFELNYYVHNMTYFDTPYEFEVYIPKSEITNWPNIISMDTNFGYVELNNVMNINYRNGGCYLNVVSANISDEVPFTGAPECKKLYYRFFINNQ